MKKRYLYFPTYKSDWVIVSPQYVICGDPSRFAFLNPTTNASSILWEQIEPNPLTNPVVITPNNTAKNITVNIPTGIITNVVLRVTLNGDSSNPRFVTIIPLLIDNLSNFSKGGQITFTNGNTLTNPIPYIFVPIVSDGSQAVFFTSPSQQTGVRFLTQYYRNTYTAGITINDTQTVSNIVENRIKLNINTSYSLLKNWFDIKVLSQTLGPVDSSINLSIPSLIADEIIYNPFTKGNAIVASTRTPYTVDIYNIQENIINFSKGNAIIGSTRTPYTVDTYSLLENITNNFTKGNAIVSFTRTPYTSNIVG